MVLLVHSGSFLVISNTNECTIKKGLVFMTNLKSAPILRHL